MILTLLLGSALAGPTPDLQSPGSLLLFPEFDNRAGIATVITVTNTATMEDDVDVEFVYIGKFGPQGTDIGCQEFNRTERLTPNDTFTLLTIAHNPEQEQGFVYAFARESVGVPRVHNFLVGNVLTVSGLEAFEYSVNACAFQGFAGDVNGNGLRDLNGIEYSRAAEEILIPRFFGQNGIYTSELVLLGLAGGAAFDTKVDFLIYNDNEEVFSSEFEFRCWARVPLTAVSNLFLNDYLADFTNNDPLELLGAPQIETGWMRLRGGVASSNTDSIADPAIFATLIERVGNQGGSDLPFGTGENDTGALFGRSESSIR